MLHLTESVGVCVDFICTPLTRIRFYKQRYYLPMVFAVDAYSFSPSLPIPHSLALSFNTLIFFASNKYSFDAMQYVSVAVKMLIEHEKAEKNRNKVMCVCVILARKNHRRRWHFCFANFNICNCFKRSISTMEVKTDENRLDGKCLHLVLIFPLFRQINSYYLHLQSILFNLQSIHVL